MDAKIVFAHCLRQQLKPLMFNSHGTVSTGRILFDVQFFRHAGILFEFDSDGAARWISFIQKGAGDVCCTAIGKGTSAGIKDLCWACSSAALPCFLFQGLHMMTNVWLTYCQLCDPSSLLDDSSGC